jgi:hypothetical protein
MGTPFSNRTTSRAAAHIMDATGKTDSQRDRVLALLRRFPNGLTDAEISGWLGIGARQASTRRKQLESEGLVRDSGRTTLSLAGVANIVWIACDDGQIPLKLPSGIRTRPALRAYRDRLLKMIDEVRALAPHATNHRYESKGWNDACDEILKRMEAIE